MSKDFNKDYCIFSFINPSTGGKLEKQYKFFKSALDAAAGKSKKKFIYFGGGVNCGKSYTALFTLMYLCKLYPKSKWYVIRKSMPALISTTVETAKKLFIGAQGKWYQGKDNFRYEFANGSSVHFFSENYDADKELFRFRGLEFNGALLEEANELQPVTFNKTIERSGRWKIQGGVTPSPLIMATFNPSPHEFWRELFYYPHKTGNIKPDTEILMATYLDNPFITQAELEMYYSLKDLDSKHYDMFINGNWDSFENVLVWAYAFNKNKHIGTVEYNPNEPVILSFDFNVNPIVCILAQYYEPERKTRVFGEIKLNNSNIYEMCDTIKQRIKNRAGITICGDASGKNRNVAIKNNASYYTIILNELGLPPGALNGVPSKNLPLNDSRVVVNAALEHYDILIDSSCKNLITDLQVVETDSQGKINKGKDSETTHLLDAFRYLIHKYYTIKILKG